MSKTLAIPLTWGELVKEPAVSCQGGDFPAISFRRVYLPIGYFEHFHAVNEALIKAMPDVHVMPRLDRAPAYLTVFDPPLKKALPTHVQIEDKEEDPSPWATALRGTYRRWLRWF